MWFLLFGLLLAADASMLEGETYESFNEGTDANMVELETYEPINEGNSHGKHIHGAQHTTCADPEGGQGVRTPPPP